MTPSIEVNELSIFVGQQCLVESLSLRLMQGTPLTILGQTGSGKSLLAQAIMGLLPEEMSLQGEILYEGQPLLTLPKAKRQALWGRALAMLPQEPWHALDPVMKSQQQVAEVFELVVGMEEDQSQEKAGKALAEMGLAPAKDKIPSQLSGGMAQRLAFLAATAAGGDLILADEPTKGLDYSRRDQIVALLQSRLVNGSLLTITHDVDVARQLGGELIVMCQGQVVEQGDAATILAHPQADYTRQLLAAEPSSWNKVSARTQSSAEPIVTLDKVALSRGGNRLFSDLSFQLHAGEILGIVGDSGTGKSSLGDLLLGHLQPDQGRIRYAETYKRHQLLKLYQDPPAAFSPHIPLGRLLQEVIDLHGLDAAQIPRLMTRLKLSEGLLSRTALEVSGGELQRIALLRILLLKPVLLFADEPTSRLDLISAQRIMELLVEVAREEGCALVLVSHDPVLVEKVCDQVIRIAQPI